MLRNEERQRSPGGVSLILASALVTLSLCCEIRVVPGVETESFLVSFLSKLARAFPGWELKDLFIFAGAYALLGYARRRCPKRDGWALALSGLFALLLLLSVSFRDLESIGFFNENKFQLFISALCVAGYWVLFYAVLRLIFAYAQALSPQPLDAGRAAGRLWLLGALLIFCCWIVWTLCNYPGALCYDSYWQLSQFLGVKPWTGHHPPLSTAILGLFLSLGMRLWDARFGCFLYCLFQTALGAVILSYGVKRMRELGAGMKYCVGVLLVFALYPTWGMYSQWFEKDLLYALMATLDLFLLMDIVRLRRCSLKAAAAVALVTVLAALLRNNGIYELLPILLALVFYLKKAERRRCLVALASVLLVFVGVTKVLYPALGVEAGSVREMLSIPFQQTARYVVTYGDEVTDSEREAIDGVIMYDEIKDIYNPVLSDPVKDTYRGDNSRLPAYFRAWLGMLKKHPGVYFSALYHQCYGALAPVCSGMTGGLGYPDYELLLSLGLKSDTERAPIPVLNQIRSLSRNLPVLKYLGAPGLYTWLLLACAVYLIRLRRYWALIPLIPGVMNVLICIASPMMCTDRYALPLMAAMPMLLCWTVLMRDEPKPELPLSAQ